MKAPSKWLFAFAFVTSLLALFAFLDIGEDMVDPGWPQVEEALRAYLPARTPLLTQLALACTWLGSSSTLLLMTLLGLVPRWSKRPGRDRLALLAVALGASGGNLLLKGWFQRARPGLDFNPLVEEPYFSFPSGHTMISLCLYGFLLYLMSRKLGSWGSRLLVCALGVVVVLAIGLSRVYLAAHFPGDVLGGFAAGWPCLCLAILIHYEVSSS